MYQSKVDLNMLNAVKSVLADVSSVSTSSELDRDMQINSTLGRIYCNRTSFCHRVHYSFLPNIIFNILQEVQIVDIREIDYYCYYNYTEA